MGWLSNTWNSVKENASGICHGVLDVAGFVPGLGAVPDVLNAGLYAMEGNQVEAGMSLLAAIPGIGDTAAAVGKGGKYLFQGGKFLLGKGGKLIEGSRKLLKGLEKFKFFEKLKDLKKLKLFGKMETGAELCLKKEKSFFKQVVDKIKSLCKWDNGCFLQDTLVWTKKGLQVIQNLEPGDWVYARKEETDEVELKEVNRVFVNEVHMIYKIRLGDDQVIKTTNYHPFYVEDKGWVCAIQLQEGERLCTIEGSIEEVVSIEKERIEEGVPVYNLEVADWNSYFVSELGICVHNSEGPCGGIKKFIDDLENVEIDKEKMNPKGNGKGIPSNEELSSAAKEWANMQKKLAPSKRKADNFNTATVVYDKKTGEYYYGMNNGVNISGDKKSGVLFGDGNIKGALPDKSLNDYKVGNCAEVDAVNQALNNNADMKDLIITTVDATPRGIGTLKPACENCTYTFKGKVAGMTAGYKGE